jgi:hypothetical protein
MTFPEELSARLVEWAKAEFAQAVETGFRKARIFDSPWNKMGFDTLDTFSPEEQRILGNILPTRTIEDPEFENALLSERERSLVETFDKTYKQLVLERREDLIERAVSVLSDPLDEEIKKMQRVAKEKFRELAKQWECEIRKVEVAAWRLCRLERWGKLFIFFGMSEKIELSYYIDIEDNDYRDVVKRHSYPGQLGIASGKCEVTDAEMCADKIRQVAEVVNWQVEEYTKIIESLDWPR